MQAITTTDVHMEKVTLKRQYIENASGLKETTNNILCIMDGRGYLTARQIAGSLDNTQAVNRTTLRRVYDVLTVLKTVGWVKQQDDKYEYRGPRQLCMRIVYLALVKAYKAREFVVMEEVSRNTAGVVVSQMRKLSIEEAVDRMPIPTDKLIEVLDVEMLGFLMRNTTLESCLLSEYVMFHL